MTHLPCKTYPCQEHGEIAVPISDLMIAGQLEIFPEVTGRGFFDIDFRRGQLILVAKGFVGLIPVNSRISIHVTPRCPVDNVLYLVQRAKRVLEYLPGHNRTYQFKKLPDGRAEELFTATLLDCLIEIERNGLMHRYVSYVTDYGWRGRLLVAPTVNNYITRGIRYRQTREVTELSTDIPEKPEHKRDAVPCSRLLLAVSRQQITGKSVTGGHSVQIV